jgi:hypothetical protein
LPNTCRYTALMRVSASSPERPGTHSMGGVSSKRLTPSREAGPKGIDISWFQSELMLINLLKLN